MLYQVVVKVEGHNTFVKHPYELTVGPYIVKVNSNEQKLVTELCITIKVPNYEECLYEFQVGTAHEHSLVIPHNPYHNDIISLLQHIESFGSFWFSIKKIHWDKPKPEWIPENEEERKRITINNFEFDRSYNLPPTEMHPKTLQELIELQGSYKHLVIPLAFYREGANEYHSQRYINAFFNFYYYLEDLYGGGKTKNKQVEQEFKQSSHFTQAIEETIRLFQDPASSEHLNNLNEFLKTEGCSFSVDGLISLIVKVRGNLHHFSQRSSKKKGHPFNQTEFKTMAYLLMSVCIYTFCNLTTGEKPR